MRRLLLVAVLASMPVAAEQNLGPRVMPVEPLAPLDRDKVLLELEKASESYSSLGKAYNFELRASGMRELKERLRLLDHAYRGQVEDLESLEHERRLEALKLLEEFVTRYPNHPEHTPDAMYRLADLYFERAQVDGYSLQEQYEHDLDLYKRGKVPAEPQSPEEDYGESIKLYDELLRRFPTYRLGDAVLYKMGYLASRGGDDRAAREAFERLARTYGDKSTLTAEAWLRVGELRFEDQEWRLAEQAYDEAAKYPDSKYYPMVLYKRAWTYFMAYDYPRAIRGFKELIQKYDGVNGTKSKLGAALREEAVVYLARSLAEDDWNGDNEPDVDAGPKRALSYLNEKTPAEQEILAEYAKSLFDLFRAESFRQAAEVYAELIARDPGSTKNPEYQERIIEAYSNAGDEDRSLAARNAYVVAFGRGTPWFEKHRDDAGATSRVDRTVEVILRQQGAFDHARAQNLKTEGKTVEAREAYLAAAKGYRQYLAQYPRRPEAYETRFMLAEALYYAGQFLDAAVVYAEVRELQGKHRQEAGFSAIASYEQHLEGLVRTKTLDDRVLARNAVDPPMPEGRQSELVRVPPVTVPEAALGWVGVADRYLELGFEDKKDPEYPAVLAYRAALLFYNHQQFDEARRRFEDVVKKYPLKKEAAFSAFNIINSYKAENDWKNIELWTDRIAKEGIGRPEDLVAVQSQIAGFRLGQQFDRAQALFDEKKYVEAAEEFERVINKDQKSAFADKALYNAAVAYQNAKYWNSAARVFERIVTEPRFAGSQYREDALFYMGENSRKFFSFDRAVAHYATLAQAFPASERAPYALFQAARLQEMQGSYEQAVSTYRRYAVQFGSRDDANSALYNVGKIHERTGDKNAEIALWKEFLARFSSTKGADAKLVEANLRLGDLYKGKNDWKQASRYYEAAIAEFERRGLQPGSAAAAFPAKARFELIEADFRGYESIRLTGSLQAQGRAIQLKRQKLAELEGRYADVFPYKAFDWTVAGFFRIGHIYQLFAKMLYDAPDPPGLSDEDLDLFRTQVEEEALKWENVAIERYEVTVKNSRELKIVNEWSQRALKELNAYKPNEYPLFKAERRQFDFTSDTSLPVVPTADAPTAEPPPDEPPPTEEPPAEPEIAPEPEPTPASAGGAP